MARRMRLVLPRGWFGDTAPVLDTALSGLGTGMASLYSLIQAVRQQARLKTATGIFLNAISYDFFGSTMVRWNGEQDDDYRQRLGWELLRPRATRNALELAFAEVTGSRPTIFEPSLASDTGGYTIGGVGYNAGGGWGNLQLPYQFFLTIFRPSEGAIALLAGYGTGGVPVYGSLAMETNGPSDDKLVAMVQPLLPAATIAWCRVTNAPL